MPRVVVSDTLNVTLFDTGESILVSGTEREDVELVLKQLVEMGATVIDKPSETGPIWTATCRRPDIPNGDAHVEQLGHRFFIRGRALEAVRAKVSELAERGARLNGKIEKIDNYFIAVCDDAPMGP